MDTEEIKAFTETIPDRVRQSERFRLDMIGHGFKPKLEAAFLNKKTRGAHMKYHTDSSKNDVLYRHLSVLGKCYSTGYFDSLFPLLCDEIVLEAQCILEPLTGKQNVVEYYTSKGKTFRDHNCCPHCKIVRFIGNLNTVDNSCLEFNRTASFGAAGLWYEDKKLALLMQHPLDIACNSAIADLTLDEHDMICRIDYCDPEFFRFEILHEDPLGAGVTSPLDEEPVANAKKPGRKR